MPGTELEAWVTPVNSKSANPLLSGTSVLWTICYVLDLLRGVLLDSEEMKARECGWSVRHYAETEKLLKDITSHVCFLIIEGVVTVPSSLG